jgi:hypothetical protein
MISFNVTEEQAIQLVVEGLQSRFEKEVYAAMREDLDKQIKLFEAQGEAYVRQAAKAAAKAYVASVREYRGVRDAEPHVVLLLDRKEVPLAP